MPADGTADVVLIDWPGTPGTPHVRAATVVANASRRCDQDRPAGRRQLPQDRPRADAGGRLADAGRLAVGRLGGRGSAVQPRPARSSSTNVPTAPRSIWSTAISRPAKLIFTATPRATGGGSTLLVDAQLDIQNAGWLIRRLVKLSPAGEPAALIAASYVTLRAVALRAENAGIIGARRPAATPAPPPAWSPSARVLADEKLAALRAHGAVALVARTWSQRLAGVAVATTLGVPTPNVLGRLRDPESWHAFPGWRTIKPRPGPNGLGAKVEDNLPFVDLEATWMAEPGNPLRWTATDGVITGARLGWEIYPIDPRANAGAPTLMALMMYPRLETTGRLARKAIASEPLLEHGLAVAVAFADVTAMKTELEAKR